MVKQKTRTWPQWLLWAAIVLAAGLLGAQNAWAIDPVPVPWNSMDIGGPTPVGSAQCDNGTFTLTAGGADIAGASDQFHSVYQSITGDFALIARVHIPTSPGNAAKAGLMVRDALAATANHVAVLRMPIHGVLSQYRTSYLPQSGLAVLDLPAPDWLRLVKRGTTVDSYVATDANGSPGTWRKVGGDEPIPSGMVYVGMCLTSCRPGASATATFDHVSLATGPQPALDDGTYSLVPVSAPAMTLTVTGSVVALAPPAAGSGRTWVFTGRGGDQYSIRPASDPSRALTVVGGGTADGTKLTLQIDTGQPAARWSVIANGTGTYGLAPQCAPDHGLDDLGGNATPDAIIDIWSRWAGDPHTQWTLTPAP